MNATIVLNQIVQLPNGHEECMTVYGVFASVNDARLPQDAYLVGHVYTPGVLDVYYSESWRTWFPLGPRLIQRTA